MNWILCSLSHSKFQIKTEPVEFQHCNEFNNDQLCNIVTKKCVHSISFCSFSFLISHFQLFRDLLQILVGFKLPLRYVGTLKNDITLCGFCLMNSLNHIGHLQKTKYRAIVTAWVVIVTTGIPAALSHGVVNYPYAGRNYTACLFLVEDGYNLVAFQVNHYPISKHYMSQFG